MTEHSKINCGSQPIGTCTHTDIQQCKLQCITHRQSLKLQLSHSYSKCVFETSRFIGLYQLTITLIHFKYELSRCLLEYM